jgi:hypothetical protein
MLPVPQPAYLGRPKGQRQMLRSDMGPLRGGDIQLAHLEHGLHRAAGRFLVGIAQHVARRRPVDMP